MVRYGFNEPKYLHCVERHSYPVDIDHAAMRSIALCAPNVYS